MRRWRQPLVTWGPLAVGPAAFGGACTALGLPRWAVMWAVAAGLGGGVKWSAWWSDPGPHGTGRLGGWRALAFGLAWPGMDPTPFHRGAVAPPPPARVAWLWAVAKVLFGVVLIGTVRPLLPPPLLRAWVGMAGLVFVLHFGLIDLLALGFRRAGFPVEPLMDNPLAACSLGDLWGARWNRGFRDWAHRLVFRPTEASLGTAVATGLVFLVSGLIHEAAISLPAGGGLGRPLAYFLIQGAGALSERTRWGRRWGLRHGWRGRLWAVLVAVAPLGLLFHPPFALRVINPFLDAVSAFFL